MLCFPSADLARVTEMEGKLREAQFALTNARVELAHSVTGRFSSILADIFKLIEDNVEGVDVKIQESETHGRVYFKRGRGKQRWLELKKPVFQVYPSEKALVKGHVELDTDKVEVSTWCSNKRCGHSWGFLADMTEDKLLEIVNNELKPWR